MSNEKNMLKCLVFASALLAASVSFGDAVLEGDGATAKAIGVAARLATNDSFTVEAWVKIDTDAGNLENVLWAQYAYGVAGRCDLFVRSGRLGMFIGSNTDAVGNVAANETLYATGTFPYGEWVLVAFSRDWGASAYAFYVNGVASGTGTSNGSMLHVKNMTVGGLFANVSETANNIVGRLAEVRVWNRVRTADEIAANKNRRLSGGETASVPQRKYGKHSAGNYEARRLGSSPTGQWLRMTARRSSTTSAVPRTERSSRPGILWTRWSWRVRCRLRGC